MSKCPICNKEVYELSAHINIDTKKVHIECFFDESIPNPPILTEKDYKEKIEIRKKAIEKRAEKINKM